MGLAEVKFTMRINGLNWYSIQNHSYNIPFTYTGGLGLMYDVRMEDGAAGKADSFDARRAENLCQNDT